MSDYRLWAISGHLSLSMKKKGKLLSRMGNCAFSNLPWVRKSRHSPGDVKHMVCFYDLQDSFCNPKGIEQPDLKVNGLRSSWSWHGVHSESALSQWPDTASPPLSRQSNQSYQSGRAWSHSNAIDFLSQQPENLTWASFLLLSITIRRSHIYWVLPGARHTNPWFTHPSW